MARSSIEHHTSRLDAVDLHYVTTGPRTGEPIVLLHGFPEFWYGWRHQLSALSAVGCRAFAPDLRGYNRSSHPRGVEQYDLPVLVDDIRHFCTTVADRPVHLVGHDWGGILAWAVGADHPETVASLTVCNAPHPDGYLRTLWSSREQRRRSWYVAAAQIPFLPEWWLRSNEDCVFETVIRSRLERADAFTAADYRLYREAFTHPRAWTTALHYYRAATRRVLRGRFGGSGFAVGRVSVPTVVCWGGRDAALSNELLAGLSDFVAPIDIRCAPQASHWIHHDRPGLVTDAILDSVARATQ